MQARRFFTAPTLGALQRLRRFELERNPLWWTPGVEHLCASDVEPMDVASLLELDNVAKGTITELTKLSLGYPDSQGSEELRSAIANIYGQHVGAEHVTVCAPQEGILLSMLAMLKPSDVVVAVTPSYQSLYEISRSIGCEIRPWQVSWDNGSARFDPDLLPPLLDGASVLVTNFPHNPTGALPTTSEWQTIGDLCSEYGVRIFSDEMYQGLESSPDLQLVSAVELGQQPCGGSSRHVSLSGLSKWAAMPGLRVGWVVSQDLDLVAAINELKDYVSICPPAPSEFLAQLALRHRGPVLARSRKLCAEGRDAVRSFCLQHDEWIEWIEPRGSSTCFPKLKHGASASEWCNELANDDRTRSVALQTHP